MNNNTVLRLFAQLARLDEGEAMEQQPLVDLAVTEVEGALREGIDPSCQEELLCLVCAAQAGYRYALMRDASAPDGSFSAGGVSVSSGSRTGAARARRLRDELWGAAHSVLRDDAQFLFRRMEES